ncbi:MAG: DUF4149 domain-containing protein [Deferrisomatales bacterium]|nr:DUF4149 domain-containing protein [Deferrisomatales bacterium]
MRPILAAALRLTLGLWVGGIAIFTFLLTPAIFHHYPREEAGRIVGVLFPLYFPYLTALSVAALLLYGLLRRDRWRAAHGLALVLLLGAVAANGYNQLWVHPQSRAVKAKIHAGAELPPDNPLRREFARLHGVSMALNLSVLAGGAVLLLGGPLWWREKNRSHGFG